MLSNVHLVRVNTYTHIRKQYIHKCTHAYTYVHAHIHTQTHTQTGKHTHTHTHTHHLLYTHTSTHVFMSSMHKFMCRHMHIHMYTCINFCPHTLKLRPGCLPVSRADVSLAQCGELPLYCAIGLCCFAVKQDWPEMVVALLHSYPAAASKADGVCCEDVAGQCCVAYALDACVCDYGSYIWRCICALIYVCISGHRYTYIYIIISKTYV